MINSIIPSQEKGKSVELKQEIKADDEAAAKKIFRNAADLLYRPSLWHEVAGKISASFAVDGEKEIIEQGDHIRISIPGPGLSEGDGDDWVIVDRLEENPDSRYDESLGLTLKVCPNPHGHGDTVAHFFAEGASSTFLLVRTGSTVTAYYFGRNEVANTKGSGLTDKIRNVVVAGGALAGMSELQWGALLKGFLLNVTAGK